MRIQQFIDQLFNYLAKYKLVILVSSFLFAAFLIFQIKDLKVLLSISDTVGDQVPTAKLTEQVKEEFDLGHQSYFSIFKKDSELKIEDVCHLKKWIKEEVWNNNKIISVSSPFNLRYPESTAKSLWYKRVLELPCEQENLSFNLWQKKLVKATTGDFFTSFNKSDLSFQVDFKPENIGKFGNFNPETFETFYQKLKLSNKKVEVHAAGDMAFLYWVTVGIKWYNKLNFIFLIILLFCFRYFFGTWRGGILLCLNFLFSGILLYGLLSLFKVSIDTLSNGLFLMISVAALEDFIFLSQLRAESESSVSVFKKLFIPSLFTSITTIIGFGSLVVADMPMIIKFGVWAAIGAVIEFVVTFIIMPCFINAFPYFEQWVKPKVNKMALTDRIVSKNIPYCFSILLILVGVLSLTGLMHLNIEMDPVTYFPKNHEFKQSINYLSKNRGWVDQVSLIFIDGDQRDKNVQIIEQIETLPIVSKVDSIYKIFADITKNENEIRKKTIEANYKQTANYKVFVRNKSRAIIYLKERSTKSLKEFQLNVKQICHEECQLSGDSITFTELSEKVPSILLNSFLISIVLVFLIILICGIYQKTNNLFYLIIGSLWGPMIVIGIIAIFQIPLNHMSIVFIGVLIGLTGDNAIQYIFAGESNLLVGLEKRGSASLQIMVFMLAASIIFQFTYFVPPRKLGLLLCIGYITSFIGDYWIVKSLIKKSNPSKL